MAPGWATDTGVNGDGTDGSRRERGAPAGRGRRTAVVIALILGLAGFAVSAVGVALQLLPRHLAPESRAGDQGVGSYCAAVVGARSRTDSPRASARSTCAPDQHRAPGIGLRQGGAPSARCAALRKNGCEAVLRATYVDATRSYVMTVGVAVLPSAAAATSADPTRGACGLGHGGLAAGTSRRSASAARRPVGVYDYHSKTPRASRRARTSSCTPPGTPTAGRAGETNRTPTQKWPPIWPRGRPIRRAHACRCSGPAPLPRGMPGC